MAGINRTAVAVFGGEQGAAVDVSGTLWIFRVCLVIGCVDDLTAARGIVGVEVIGLGDEDDRQIGVLCADGAVELFVRRLQMLGGRCVVVVVADKDGHIESCHVVDDRVLTSCRAGEAEVDVVDVAARGDDVLIRIAGSGCAAALGNRGAVVNDRLDGGILGTAGQCGAFAQTDFQRDDVVVQREVDRVVVHLTVARQVLDGFVSGFHIPVRHKGADVGVHAHLMLI